MADDGRREPVVTAAVRAAEPAGRRSLGAALSAAVLDAALASLATLAVGLYAARQLTLDQLGGYGLVFLAVFMLGSSTTTQLYCTPAELALLDRDSAGQLRGVFASVRRGAAAAAAVGLVAAGVAGLFLGSLAGGERLTLAGTGAAVAVLSPLQDHARRVLHQAGRSALAARVSAVHTVAALALLAVLHLAGIPAVAVPLTALAGANAVSLAAALLMAGTAAHRATRPLDGVGRSAGAGGGGGPLDPGPPPLRDLLRQGVALTVTTQVDQVAGFAGAALVGQLAGLAAVGQIEAARQLAQPLFVLSSGLASVLRPRVMAAARHGDAATARRHTTAYVGLLGAAAGAYVAVAGVAWAVNPLPELLPNAYARNGLLAAMIAVTAAAFATQLIAAQAVAARREAALARISVTNAAVYLGVVALAAPRVAAFAVPAASAVNTVMWLARVRPVLASIYARHTLTPAAP